jgi:hypothetical protein
MVFLITEVAVETGSTTAVAIVVGCTTPCDEDEGDTAEDEAGVELALALHDDGAAEAVVEAGAEEPDEMTWLEPPPEPPEPPPVLTQSLPVHF